jgi:parallel beta-helix repeat protein
LSGNLMTSNTYNFGVVGGALSDFVNNVDTSNLVDGKPVYYLMNKSDITISPGVYPEVGYLGLVNCKNVTVQGLTLTHNDIGLLLAFTNSSRITDNSITANSFGIYLDFSINNTLIGNNITVNSYGVWLDYSDNTTLLGNNLTNDGLGVVLAFSSWVSISANNVTNDGLGVELASSPNNDVFGNNITANSSWGILIEPYSDNNTLAANNIAANSGDGVDLTYGSGDVLSGNNVTANMGNGVDLTYSDNNTLSGNAVTANYAAGIFLWNCSGNVLSGNDATANGGIGIDFWPNSDNNTLVGNTVTANGIDGIMLDGPCDNNTLYGNNVTANNNIGIYLLASSNNIVSWNNATANHFGIYLGGSSNNSVTGNNVNANTVGIVLQLSSGNTFYHNNFINNSQQVSIINATGQMSTTGSPNTWDNGYPSGGNYWSDYQMAYPSAIENDSSGIWNTPYVIDSNNTDRYPLMGPFNTFGVGTWNGAAYSVDTVSNSTITSLSFNATAKTLSFNVTGTSGTPGFCRVDIPTGLMSGKWTLIVGGTLYSNQTVIQSGNYTYIYFAYTQGTKTVQIQSTATVPEFQPLVLLPLFMIITLLAAMIIKRKQNARAQSQ